MYNCAAIIIPRIYAMYNCAAILGTNHIPERCFMSTFAAVSVADTRILSEIG